MNKQDIIQMAREAGCYREDCGFAECDFDAVMRFAALVAEKERKARKAAQLEIIALREDFTKIAMQAEKKAYQRGARDEREAFLAEIETGIWFDKTTEEVLAELAAAIRTRNNKDNQQ